MFESKLFLLNNIIKKYFQTNIFKLLLNKIVMSKHNCKFWNNRNARWMMKAHIQYPERYNVWVTILNNQLISPFFIRSNLIATKYEEMLRNKIIPVIRQIVDNMLCADMASAGWRGTTFR